MMPAMRLIHQGLQLLKRRPRQPLALLGHVDLQSHLRYIQDVPRQRVAALGLQPGQHIR